MIFWIDKSCLAKIDRCEDTAVLALEMLALNRIKGKNILLAEKNVLEYLHKKECFSEPTRKLFNSLFQNAAEHMMYLKLVEKYIIIVDEIIENKDKGQNLYEEKGYKVTLQELASLDISNYTELVTENLLDANFYKLTARYYIKSEDKLAKCEVKFDCVQGGGSTIAEVAKQKVKSKNRLFICIVDSDKKYPKCKRGDTCKKVEGFLKKTQEEIWQVLPLDVHEVENLLPISWLKKCSKDIKTSSNTIKFLEHLIEVDKNEHKDKAVYYFDMKDGITNYNKKNEEFKRFWKPYLKSYGIKLDNLEDDNIIYGFGGKILEKVLNEYENEKIFSDLGQCIEDKWLLLGKNIFTWGCVLGRVI